VGIIAALIAAVSALVLAGLTRAHERDKQVRERMLLAADEALQAFQQAARAVSVALISRNQNESAGQRTAFSEAGARCGDARAAAGRIALLFHPQSPSRHLAVRSVEALERLYRFAKDPDNQRLPGLGESADKDALERDPAESQPPGGDSAPVPAADEATREQATGLLQTIDDDLWDRSAYYRVAVGELVAAMEAFILIAWEGLRTPLRSYPAEMRIFGYGYFTLDRRERELEQMGEQRRAELPHRRLLAYLARRSADKGDL